MYDGLFLDDNNHWDIGLYMSGLDFYAQRGGSKVTMGLATGINNAQKI